MKKILFLLILSIGFINSFDAQTLNNGLKLHYSFENNVIDSSTNQQHLIPNSLFQYETVDSNDQAIYFDGTYKAQQINTYNNTGFSQMAVSLWFRSVRMTTSADQGIIQGASMSPYISIEPNTGQLAVAFTPPTSNSITSSANYVDSTWHHVVAQNNGNFSSVYVDGILIGSRPELITKSTNGRFYLGATNLSTRFFKGAVNDVRIYDRLLSTAEITILGTKTTPSNIVTDSLQAHYMFENDVADSSRYQRDLLTNPLFQYEWFNSNDQAIYFDGTYRAEQVSTFDNSNFNQMAIALWFRSVRMTSSADQGIIQGASMSPYISIEPNTGQLAVAFTPPTSNSITSSANYVDSTWHHVVAQNNGSQSFVYVDGVLIGSRPELITKSTNGKFYLGATNLSTRFFKGAINDVRIYSRILSQVEIDSLSRKLTTSIRNKTISNSKIKLFPNPTNGTLTLTSNKSLKGTRINVLSITGKLISSNISISENFYNLNIVGESGIYIIETIDTLGNRSIQKVIKR